MALACTWGGYADTDVDFTEFFGADHTVAARFMLQYPHAYTGPMLSVNGTGIYLVGQGNFAEDPPGAQTKLILRVGSTQATFPAVLVAGTWHHLAVVRSGSVLRLYLDGQQQGSPLTIPGDGQPVGTLRLGKDTFNGTLDGGASQFYGLLDDVAVFTSALTQAEIGQLAGAQHLTGTEQDLLAGFVFGYAPLGFLPASLSRPLTLVSTASLRAVSPARDNAADAQQLPLPPTALLHLPFPEGEEIFIIQGYDQPAGGSHAGRAAFCWDFMLAGHPQSDSNGVAFRAAAPGAVNFVTQDATSGGQTNFMTIKDADHEFGDYLHLRQNSAVVSAGDAVGFGQHLADIGDTGVAVGAYHLHFATTNLGESNKNAGGQFVTVPAPMCNYEVSDDQGQTWREVIRGIPSNGQWVRRPVVDTPVRYTAVWHPSTAGEIQVYGWTYEDYRAKYDELWPQGLRLNLLSVYVVDGQVRYTAVWHPSTAGEIQVYGWTYEDYRAKYDAVWDVGWRLKLLDAFVL